jgi:predicted phosphodiesterase
MRIQLLSDMHLDHSRDWGDAFVESLDFSDADVVVLAGDVANAPVFYRGLVKVAQKAAPKPLVYVLGNHEYYGSDRLAVRNQLAHLPANVHWLDYNSVTIDGVTFLGGTGWFDQRKIDPMMELNFSDFHYIAGLRQWVYVEHAAYRKFLAQQALRAFEGKRVLVTHHAPSYKAVLPRWQRSTINDFFYVDCEAEITKLRPDLVLHGHMHSGLDYQIGTTRVVCNPRGYPGERQDMPFDPRLILEV